MNWWGTAVWPLYVAIYKIKRKLQSLFIFSELCYETFFYGDSIRFCSTAWGL